VFPNQKLLRLGIPLILAYAYFVVFPGDLTAVLAPAGQILNLTTAVSPWFYALIGVGIVAWCISRIWSGRARQAGEISSAISAAPEHLVRP
jgi:hypothetical protein